MSKVKLSKLGKRLFLGSVLLVFISGCTGVNDKLLSTSSETLSADIIAAVSLAQAGGGGQYPALMVEDSGLPTHTLYRPKDLSAFVNDKLPIVVWGNGACLNWGNRFRYFLTEIASHGYFIAAIGPVGPAYLEQGPSSRPPQAAADDTPPTERTDHSDWKLLIKAIDWAVAETNRKSSPYYGRLDPSRIAVMGQSCGGLQATLAAADPRVSTTVVWNSGTFADGARLLQGAEATRADVAKIHSSVAYISGDASDIAFTNANADFELITSVPAIRAFEHGVGHTGTYRSTAGGSFGQVAIAWLDWQLKNSQSASAWFVGADCKLCRDERWDIQKKNID